MLESCGVWWNTSSGTVPSRCTWSNSNRNRAAMLDVDKGNIWLPRSEAVGTGREGHRPEGTAAVTKSIDVVFIHGLFSSRAVWASFERLIGEDSELDGLVSVH